MASLTSARTTLWPQVWGLAAVQGTIALTWVIYNLYLLKLLTQFGFSAAVATGVLVVENLLSAGMEPLMGSLSDRAQRWVGSRFPFIAIGIVLASACFMGIPLFVVFGNPAARWLLPVLLLAWALAMTVFRSPTLSLLGRYAFETRLPQAASILTLVGGVAGAMGPLANQFILGLGPMVAFSVGSIVMLLAATVLRLVNPDKQVQAPDATGATGAMPRGSWGVIGLKLALVFGSGAGMSLGFRLLMQTFPRILKTQVLQVNPNVILGCIFLALAVTAIPAGALATRLGNRIAMIGGVVAMAVFTGLTIVVHHPAAAIGVAIALGAAFSLVSNGTIPYALAMVPANKAGLGTGMYFGGGALATSVFAALFQSPEAWSPIVALGLGAGAFLITSLLIAASYRLPNTAQP